MSLSQRLIPTFKRPSITTLPDERLKNNAENVKNNAENVKNNPENVKNNAEDAKNNAEDPDGKMDLLLTDELDAADSGCATTG